MFKVGDWYIDDTSSIIQVTKIEQRTLFRKEKTIIIFSNNVEFCVENPILSKYKHWLPKEGEWVACIISSIKNMFGVFQYEEDLYNDIKDMNPDDIVTIQPFVGQLPSDLMDIKE